MKLLLFGLILISTFSSVSLSQTARNEGIELFRLGKYAESVATLEQAVNSTEADYAAAIYLGAGYVKIGMNEKAIEAFGKADSLKGKSSAEPLKYDKKIEITNRPQAKYTENDMGGERSGVVRVIVEFKNDGKIGFVFPFAASSSRLVQSAINAANQIRFKPAVLNGKPVSSVLLIEYTYFR